MTTLGELPMKKTLLALAVLGAFAGVAHAQSSVTVSGNVDLGYQSYSEIATQTASSVTVRRHLPLFSRVLKIWVVD
jgi:predicted porin